MKFHTFGLKTLQSPYDPRTQPRCDADEAGPFGDLLAGIAFVALGVGIAVAGHDAEDGSSHVAGGVGVGLLGVGLGGIGVYGLREEAKCERAQAQWDERMKSLQPGTK